MRDFEDHCWRDVVSDEVLEIYRHYHRPTRLGERCALLVVDLYNLAYYGGPKPVREIVNEHPSSCGINAWQAIEPTKQLLSLVRERNMPVFYCSAPPVRPLQATHRQRNSQDPDAYEIFHEFTPQPGEPVILKERASAFFGTPLIAYLQQLRIDTLLVCGQSTSGCVRASVVDSYSYGLHTVLVEECCFDRSELSHKVNLFDMHHKYADVMTLSEVQEHLGVLAR